MEKLNGLHLEMQVGQFNVHNYHPNMINSFSTGRGVVMKYCKLQNVVLLYVRIKHIE